MKTKSRLAFLLGMTGIVSIVACVSSDPPPADVDICIRYCDAVFNNCKGGLAQYDTRSQCNAMCAAMPHGEGGEGEDTVRCRLNHAEKGGTADECRKASPYGGGACGKTSVVFCRTVDDFCIKNAAEAGLARPPYPAKGTCQEQVEQIPYDKNAAEGAGDETTQPFDGKNNLNCRMKHLILAVGEPNPHCSHTEPTSATCVK